MGKCSICQLDKPLLKRSHIIPDFFYREAGLYDEKHQIIKMDIERFTKSKKVSRVPSGDYEGGILCAKCDNELIGDLETYGRKVLYGGLNGSAQLNCINVINPLDGIKSIICKNVDYSKFKLFLLSILFRACLSKRDLFYEAEVLDEELEKIRQMLLNGKAGSAEEFPVIVLSYLGDDTIPNDFISPALKSTPPGKTIITFLIGGFVFSFYISDNCHYMKEIELGCLSPNKDLVIMHLPKGIAWKLIMEQIFSV